MQPIFTSMHKRIQNTEMYRTRKQFTLRLGKVEHHVTGCCRWLKHKQILPQSTQITLHQMLESWFSSSTDTDGITWGVQRGFCTLAMAASLGDWRTPMLDIMFSRLADLTALWGVFGFSAVEVRWDRTIKCDLLLYYELNIFFFFFLVKPSLTEDSKMYSI